MSDSAVPRLVGELATKCGGAWPTMEKAATTSPNERSKLGRKLTDARLIPPDASVVVFGSLARDESTQGSDSDWALLVDGPVVSEHGEIARRIAAVVAGEGRKPGPSGVFGGLAFSHELVHFIGGNDDSNTNTTRRILLLLESKSLTTDEVRARVLRALLDRYVGEDSLFHAPDRLFVPRFLLNDYVRYWRTVGVDSAQKRRDRVDKWALRNIKLRLSRKLIFAAGFWACLSCQLHPSLELKASRQEKDRDAVRADMTDFLFQFSQRSPLETIAAAFLKYEAWAAAKESLDAYEDFLKILDDEQLRERLEKLTVDEAMKDEVFDRAKRAASAFQGGLTKLFFKTNEDLTLAAQTYGVF